MSDAIETPYAHSIQFRIGVTPSGYLRISGLSTKRTTTTTSSGQQS